MHVNEVARYLKGDKGLPFPPPSESLRWARIRDQRRRFEADAAAVFSHRPELHVSGDALATRERQQSFVTSPIVRDLARLSSQLLTQDVKLTYGEGKELQQGVMEEWAAFARLDALLSRGAEHVAAEGVGALRVVRDDSISGRFPVLSFEHGDSLIWSESYGHTIGGVVVVSVEHSASLVYRLFESHEVGRVRRILYKGTLAKLGGSIPLTAGPPQFASLEPRIETKIDRPTLVPWRNKADSEPDTAGCESLMDTLDELESVGREKIQTSRPLTFVHRRLVDEDRGAKLGSLAIILAETNGPAEEPKQLVDHVQPDLASTDHETYAAHLREMIVTHSGYSLASFGLERGAGSMDSGRALRLRQMRTLQTLEQKKAEAEETISEVVGVAMAMTKASPQGGKGNLVEAMKPVVVFGGSLPTDTMELAEELKTLKDAGLLSDREALRRLHPDWDDERIQQELDEIGAGKPAAPSGRLLERLNQQAS